MHVVRVFFESNLLREFNFEDVGRAVQAFNDISEAMNGGEWVKLDDDGGRTAKFRCALVQSVELIDVIRDTVAVTVLNGLIAAVQAGKYERPPAVDVRN